MSDTPKYEPLDRRPIKSRKTRWAQRVARYLADKGASPNSISMAGMVAAVLAGVAFAATAVATGFLPQVLWLAGGVLCQVRLLCNLFDGMVAVHRNTASRTGELYNEIPDRVSDAAVLIGIGYSSGGDPVLGYVAALLAVFVAYIRATAKSVGAPNDFCGPMAKPQRMALVTALSVYLAVVPSDWRWSWGEARLILAILIAGTVVTAARRLYRAADSLKGA